MSSLSVEPPHHGGGGRRMLLCGRDSEGMRKSEAGRDSATRLHYEVGQIQNSKREQTSA